MSMMDFSGYNPFGLEGLSIDVKPDSQGRYPMDPGYDPTPTTEISSPVYAGGTLIRPNPDGSNLPVVDTPTGPILDAWGRDPSNPNYGVDFDAAGIATKAKKQSRADLVCPKSNRTRMEPHDP